MLMIIPYQVDIPSSRRPLVNYVIIGITAITSMVGFGGASEIEPFILEGWNPLGLLGYM